MSRDRPAISHGTRSPVDECTHSSAGDRGPELRASRSHRSVHVTVECGALCAFAPSRLCVEFSRRRTRCRWPLAFTATGTGSAAATASVAAAGLRSEHRITLRGGDISTRRLGRYDMGGERPTTASLASAAFPSPSPCPCPSPMGWAGGLDHPSQPRWIRPRESCAPAT
jgi:hypothetical protein